MHKLIDNLRTTKGKNRRKLKNSDAYVLREQKTTADEFTLVTFEEGLSAKMYSLFNFANE